MTTEDRGYCWGNVQTFTPPDGRLGTGEFAWSKSPVAVVGDLRWRTIVAGSWHACGLTLDGDAYCWGENSAGQLVAAVAEAATRRRSASPGASSFVHSTSDR